MSHTSFTYSNIPSYTNNADVYIPLWHSAVAVSLLSSGSPPQPLVSSSLVSSPRATSLSLSLSPLVFFLYSAHAARMQFVFANFDRKRLICNWRTRVQSSVRRKMAARIVVPREAPSLSRLSLLVLCLALSCCLGRGEESAVRVITTENFDDVSQGDWMLELYALGLL